MRLAKWVGGGVWIGSWYVMYREVTRWHHVKPSLAFNYDIAPDAHPGLPLILVYIACVAAPLVVVSGWVIQIRRGLAARYVCGRSDRGPFRHSPPPRPVGPVFPLTNRGVPVGIPQSACRTRAGRPGSGNFRGWPELLGYVRVATIEQNADMRRDASRRQG